MQDESIVVSLSSEFGLDVVQIAFLPLGADQNTAVYRASADDTTDYFVKLRLGPANMLNIINVANTDGRHPLILYRKTDTSSM